MGEIDSTRQSIEGEGGTKKNNSSSSTSSSSKNINCYLFGYGSLICPKSRSLTCPELSDRTAIPVVIQGLERTWSKRTSSGMTAMGVRFRSKAQCAGILVPLYDDKELTRFDRRERGYRRVKVDPKKVGRIAFLKQQEEHEDFFQTKLHDPDTHIWVYVPEKQRPPTKDHPIAQSYVDTILRGCLVTGGEDLCAEFLANTTGWNPNEGQEQQQQKTMMDKTSISKTQAQHERSMNDSSDDDQRDEADEDEDEEDFVWINDRYNPVYRRGDAQYSRKNAAKIDRLIRRYRPEYFSLRVDPRNTTGRSTRRDELSSSASVRLSRRNQQPDNMVESQ